MKSDAILAILDRCCDDYVFPMLDNGYVYLAATRLSLFRSVEDWALVIEVFGYSPRAGGPNLVVQTFASRLHARDAQKGQMSEEAYQTFLANHPHDEFRAFSIIEDDDWIEERETVAPSAREIVVRGKSFALPSREKYAEHGIELQNPERVCVFELSRYLASLARDQVLATEAERRVSVPPELTQILQLEEWHHPDVVDDECRPSGNETFQQLARVLESGELSHYRPSQKPNTHWSYWPGGGTL